MTPIVKQKVDELFEELRGRNFVTGEGTDDCPQCAIDRLNMIARDEGFGKIAYYDEIDLEEFEDGGPLFIGYAAYESPETPDHVFYGAAQIIGRQIVECAHNVGLYVHWNGHVDSRITVQGLLQ